VTARLIANMITNAGAHRVLAVDLHAGQIQGFFDMPVDHLMAAPLIADWVRRNVPDEGPLRWCRRTSAGCPGHGLWRRC